MEKTVLTYDEMTAFIAPLLEEEKYVVDVRALDNDAGYRIQWMEHKKYTAQDGKEFHDEIWTNKEGNLMLIQDMSEAHVKNVLRMLLRNQREAREAMAIVAEALKEALQEDDDDDEGELVDKSMHISTTTGKVIH